MLETTSNYTVTTPREGLVQATFKNGCILSIGYGEGHYATHLLGVIPTSFEIAVFGPDGHFIALTDYDDVAGSQSLDMVQTILQKMERENFDPKDLELFCE